MTTLPRDKDNNPIQALRLRTDGAHQISATATAARNANAFNNETRVVGIYASGPVYLQFGESDVVATSSDHFFPAGLYYDFAIGGDKTLQYTHVSVVAADTDTVVFLSEKQ